MIVLFEEYEKDFTSLGLGVLKDATSCKVKEGLNDEFTLTMEVHITSRLYNEIKHERIIYAKPNPFDEPQPFRIKEISKPINGVVTVTANHLSYDLNDIPAKAIDANGISEVIDQIENGKVVKDESGKETREPIILIQNPFSFKTDILSARKFQTTKPYNLRALLMGDEKQSIVGIFDGELKFDKYDVNILNRRGADRGAQVRYGHNMLDLKHTTKNDKLYNKVFPYYHKESTSEEQTSTDTFKKVYIVGKTDYAEDWLSYEEGGTAYHPLDSTPVQIATEGPHFDEVVSWNEIYRKYQKKIYNEMVTVIQGVVEPTWIRIEWKSFPKVKCVANAIGYYKTPTDTDWGEQKKPGDVIFEGNILREGLSGLVGNLIIYYSEVVPNSEEIENKTVSKIVDVILDDPIINIDTKDATAMQHDRVLMLDLTSEFEQKDDSEPTQDALRTKAEEYIKKNKIGELTHETSVNFLDLKHTSTNDKLVNFEHIELGDSVKVIYEDLGVDVELRVISTEYDCLLDRYSNIELGEKKAKLSTSSVESGDNVSVLTNDAEYTNETKVSELIANTVTAEYIRAANAKLTAAMISQLEVIKLRCTGIIEASQFDIDALVSKQITTENAKIKQVLEAGTIKLAGDINIKSGEITIQNEKAHTTFRVDREGNLFANSATIEGNITAKSGNIANFNIEEDELLLGTIGETGSMFISSGKTLTVKMFGQEPITKKWTILAGDSFGLTNNGELYARNIHTLEGMNDAPLLTLQHDSTARARVRTFGLYATNPELEEVTGRKNHMVADSAMFDTLNLRYMPYEEGLIEGYMFSYIDRNGINTKFVSRDSTIDTYYKGRITPVDYPKVPIIVTHNGSYGTSIADNKSHCPKIFAKRITLAVSESDRVLGGPDGFGPVENNVYSANVIANSSSYNNNNLHIWYTDDTNGKKVHIKNGASQAVEVFVTVIYD